MSVKQRRDLNWSLKDVQRIINCVGSLKLEIPPDDNDAEWLNIDRFLQKPGMNMLLVSSSKIQRK